MKISTVIGSILLFGQLAFSNTLVTIQKSVSIQEEGSVERVILADKEGLSLYTFNPDKANESTCYDGCAKTWPPVLVDQEQAASLTGVMGTAVRRDGSLQLTIDSRPVYLFIGDEKAGDINGEGLGGVWFVIDVKLAK